MNFVLQLYVIQDVKLVTILATLIIKTQVLKKNSKHRVRVLTVSMLLENSIEP